MRKKINAQKFYSKPCMFTAKSLVSNTESQTHNILMNKSSDFFYTQRRTSQLYI